MQCTYVCNYMYNCICTTYILLTADNGYESKMTSKLAIHIS